MNPNWQVGKFGKSDKSGKSFPYVEYWTPGVMSKWTFTTIDRIPDLIERCRKENKPLYKGVYHYAKPKRSNYRLFDFVLDFDCSKEVERARADCIRAVTELERRFNIDPNSLEIGFSGNKGYYIRLQRDYFLKHVIPEPQVVMKRFTQWFSRFTPTLDTTFYNNGRLFREPNTIHEESGLYRINLTFGELQYMTTDEIKIFAVGGPREVEVIPPDKPYSKFFDFLLRIRKFNTQRKPNIHYTKPKTEIHLDNLPPRYSHLSSGVSEGQRNDAICQLCGVFETCGLSKSEILSEILKFNQRCSPPEKESIVKYKVNMLVER